MTNKKSVLQLTPQNVFVGDEELSTPVRGIRQYEHTTPLIIFSYVYFATSSFLLLFFLIPQLCTSPSCCAGSLQHRVAGQLPPPSMQFAHMATRAHLTLSTQMSSHRSRMRQPHGYQPGAPHQHKPRRARAA